MIIIIAIIIIICSVVIPTAPRIPPDQYPRRGTRRGVMSLVGELLKLLSCLVITFLSVLSCLLVEYS